MFELSESQQLAFNFIIENLSEKKIILLEGSAGSGKSTLTKYICNYYNEKKINICAIAPTHKSKKVIQNILNKDIIIPISTLTVASALGKIKEHSYIGTKVYSNSTVKKLFNYSLFIIDEVSMIRDEDLKIIINYVLDSNKRLIIIGDSNQIPSPTSKYIISDIIEKADSYIFTDEYTTKIKLKDIVRQSIDSPIIKLASSVRENLLNDLKFDLIMEATDFTNIIKYSDIYNVFETYFIKELINSCRIITYTNSSVKHHNLEVRKHLNYNEEFVIGELMTGYSNMGWPELIIENGEDYFIEHIEDTTDHYIGKFNNLCGKLIDLIVADTRFKIKDIFFINMNHSNNSSFLNRLIELAEKINKNNSTKIDYCNYMRLKNNAMFIEDIYKYEGGIFTENIFKETHPLLFININEVIVENQINKSALAKKIDETYPDIVSLRINDISKKIGDSELFADKYKVIEKDIYYGYSITAHKSQGSTYDTVIVDENDFQKISNRWNHKYNKLESRVKEKNQLRYVSYTRAKNNLFVIYEKENF